MRSKGQSQSKKRSKRRRRRSIGKNKGNQFERDICTALSLWWTDQKRDDVIWRSQNSGGRASIRRKAGKRLKGQYGDICATDKCAERLTRFMTIEIKRGYPKATIAECFDRSEGSALTDYEHWIDQAQEASRGARVPFWMIIHKRDRHETTVTIPRKLYTKLKEEGCNFSIWPKLQATLDIRMGDGDGTSNYYSVVSLQFDHFFGEVTADRIKHLERAVR